MKKVRLTILAFFLILSFGCASMHQVNEKMLVDIYAPERQQPKKYPVIFIPGTMGSMLKDQKTGKTVWGRVWFGVSRLIALPINAPFQAVNLVTGQSDLVPAGILNKYTLFPGLLEVDIYDNVRRIAMHAGGYTLNKDAFAFSYDWRKDLVDAAKQLDELIQQAKLQSGNPNLKVNLLCHSQGGLIARYYAKYGAIDVLDQNPLPEPTYAGAKNINKIIMLGTPNRGSFESFHTLHSGIWFPFIGHITPETTFTLLSPYELLPNADEQLFLDRNGVPLSVNIYDPTNWEKYGWSVFNPELKQKMLRKFMRTYGKEQGLIKYEQELASQRRFLATALSRANRFHQALWQGDPEIEKQQISYIIFGADSLPTLRRAVLTKTSTGWETQFRTVDRKIKKLLYDFGDGTVTKDSLLGIWYTKLGEEKRMPETYAVFISETHGELTKNPTFMDNILHILLSQD